MLLILFMFPAYIFSDDKVLNVQHRSVFQGLLPASKLREYYKVRLNVVLPRAARPVDPNDLVVSSIDDQEKSIVIVVDDSNYKSLFHSDVVQVLTYVFSEAALHRATG
jgi:hypothetical protein